MIINRLSGACQSGLNQRLAEAFYQQPNSL